MSCLEGTEECLGMVVHKDLFSIAILRVLTSIYEMLEMRIGL